MHTTLLQIDPLASAGMLSNYGAVGILALLCISVIIYLEKIRRAKDIETAKQLQDQQTKIDKLEERFDKYQTEDRAKMLEVIQHNTDIMEEVVDQLQKAKRTN